MQKLGLQKSTKWCYGNVSKTWAPDVGYWELRTGAEPAEARKTDRKTTSTRRGEPVIHYFSFILLELLISYSGGSRIGNENSWCLSWVT